MSGIAGIYNLDGRPADRDLLTRLTEVIAHRGPDGAGHWNSGPVGLGHRMFCTTPESLHESQPLTDDAAGLCLTFDGRVDNRQELKSAIEAKGLPLRDDTDAELVLRAYQGWGQECPGRILGDFAFAIWDGRRQELFCARDFLGIRPFCYFSDGRSFVFGSELVQLLEHPAVRPVPNEGMVAEYLADQITSQEETLYQGIYRLPPAHAMVVRREGTQKFRYWSPDLAAELRYSTDEQYAEHFLDLFREAVRCRLRSSTPVGAHLSGGLDSSSVCAVAARLLGEAGALPDLPLRTFSIAFPGMKDCDEVNYARDVAQSLSLAWETVAPGMRDLSWYAAEVARTLDFPEYPTGRPMMEPLIQQARAYGCRVLLTGHSGDAWFGGSLHCYADLLRGFHLGELLTQLRADGRDRGGRYAARQFLRRGCWPLLPAAVQQLLRRCLGKTPRYPWLPGQFVTRTDLRRRLAGGGDGLPYRDLAQADALATLFSGQFIHAMEAINVGDAAQGVEHRHPLNDRRLIEFAAAIPEMQRSRGNHGKYVLRQAMRGYLPESVRQRPDKAEFSGFFAQALRTSDFADFLGKLQIANVGWVDGAELRIACNRLFRIDRQTEPEYNHMLWVLWMAGGIELWYRTLSK